MTVPEKTRYACDDNEERAGTNMGGNLAGFQINQSELQKWKKSYPKITTLTGETDSGDDEPGIRPFQVEAECWQGNKSNRPEDPANSTRLGAVYDDEASEDGKLVVAGEIPERDVENPDQYSCVYGLQQQVYLQDICEGGGSICSFFQPATTTSLYWGGSEGTYKQDAPNVVGDIEKGVITEGVPSDYAGHVNTTNKAIHKYSLQPYLSTNNDATTLQNTPWTHFFPGSITDPRPRHPGERYCEQYDKSPYCSQR